MEEDPGEAKQVAQLQGQKKTRKAQSQSSHPDITPSAGRKSDKAAMMEMFLYMSSHMLAIEEYMTQREQADRDQDWRDAAVGEVAPGLQLGMRGGAWRQPQESKMATSPRW